MSTIIDSLIFDRTVDNLAEGDPKGKYDYVDYNRVGQAVNYVASEIGGTSIVGKTDWTNTSIPRSSDMNTYRSNVQAILDILELPNQLPSTNDSILTINGANQIEKALFDAHNLIQRIMTWNDVDNLNETWDELDAKHLAWGAYFLKRY